MKQFLLLLCLAVALTSVYRIQPDVATKKEFYESETKSLEALAWLAEMNDYPNQDAPDDGINTAFEYFKEHFLNTNSQRTTADDEWESIGPDNVGGRTLSIAIHPVDTNIIFMGSASGGLWKSTTGGIGVNAWTYVETGFPVLGVAAIAINPNNPDEIYIGTGENYAYGTSSNGLIERTERGTFGMGILKSTDGGITWAKNLDWTYQQKFSIWDIKFHPYTPDFLYAATSEGLYKTTNGGLYWSQRLDEFMVMDIEIRTDDPSVLYAAVGNLDSPNKGIYKSEDAGDNWELLTTGLPPFTHDGRITLDMWDVDNDVIVAVIANAFSTVGLYKTTDGGDTWFEMDNKDVASYQGWYAEGALIKPDNQNQILLGGVELFKSTNGGDVFTQMTEYSGPDSELHPDIHDIVANPLDPNKVYILTDGGLFRSSNFGDTYFSCNDGYTTSQFYIGSISAQTNDVGLGGLQDNFTQRFDGTNYWEAVMGGDGSFNAIDPTDDNEQFASYQYGVVYKSHDQGFTFDDFVYSAPGSTAFVTPFIICPSDNETMYLGDTRLRKSINAGSSFTTPFAADADSGNVILSIATSSISTDTVYFTAAGFFGRADVYKSVDGGSSFTAITNGLPDRYYRDIAVNYNNANELYVCLSGFDTPHIFRSQNGGDDWENISSDLPDVPFHALAIDSYNDSIIYAGSDFGVFVSFDKGDTWEVFGTGMPQAIMIFDLVISPSDNKLMAFTHGNGVYRIPLAGLPQQINVVDAGLQLFEVYPNPVDEVITLNFSSEVESVGEIKIVDMQGKVVFSNQIPGNLNRWNFDCSDFAAGTYLISYSVNGNSYVTKFIKI
jgi:photosystem II stability/assembly factor-like uncharacterized protein